MIVMSGRSRGWVLVAATLLLCLVGSDLVAQGVGTASGGPAVELLKNVLWIIFWLCLFGFLAFVLVAALVVWQAKKLVANAVRTDAEALSRLLTRLRHKHPKLDDTALGKKIIHRQALQAGLVGFATGLGGLPTLALALPIDLAATMRIQANLVHLLRLNLDLPEEKVPDAGLWVATAGGMELASAGGKALRGVLVQSLSKSLLKFVPLLGGLIGFGLNWASTQALGRAGMRWFGQRAKAQGNPQSIDGHGATDVPEAAVPKATVLPPLEP